jgi:hypothetical protein
MLEITNLEVRPHRASLVATGDAAAEEGSSLFEGGVGDYEGS